MHRSWTNTENVSEPILYLHFESIVILTGVGHEQRNGPQWNWRSPNKLNSFQKGSQTPQRHQGIQTNTGWSLCASHRCRQTPTGQNVESEALVNLRLSSSSAVLMG